MLSKLSLDSRVKSSQTIIEGEITNQRFVWNADRSRIYTVNTVHVTNQLKGTTSATVEIITPGGELDGKLLVVEPNADLSLGSRGIFMLKDNTEALEYKSSVKQYEIYSLAQGFIAQDVVSGKYSDPFDVYDNKIELYSQIGKTTGATYRLNGSANANSVSSGSIASFSPTKITAGTQSILTITGTGFGTRTGSATVQFRDANSVSSATYSSIPDSTYIVSWTNTQIQVIVPGASAFRQGGAGTGSFVVVDASGATITSPSTLTITYNQFEYKKRRISLIGQNGLGGYTFTLNQTFNNNTEVKAAFQRALDQWKCKTGVNAIIASTTTSTTCNNQLDNTNVVSFADATCPLPAGALGTTYSTYSLCANSPIMPDGMDMIFSPDASFYAGTGNPASNQYDFESVVLHELGHAFGEGHVSSGNEVMYPSIANGAVKRTLNNSSDVTNILDVVTRSTTSTLTCGFIRHTPTTPCGSVPSLVANFIQDKFSGCAPLTVAFTDKTTGNPTSWRWDIANNGSIDFTTQNPSYTFTQPGTYAVKLVAMNATLSDSIVKSTLITVYPPVSSTIATSVMVSCYGGNNGSLAVKATGGDGTYTYLWNNNQTTATISNLTAGSYNVSVKSNSCSVTTSRNVTQPDQLSVSVLTSLMGGSSNSYSATMNVAGGITPYTYSLNNSAGSRIEANTQTVSNLAPGTYNVTIKDRNNCTQSTSFSMASPTGVPQAETDFDKLEVYPNPAISNVNIDLSLKEEKNVQIGLYDLTGKTIMEDQYENVKDKQTSLDVSTLASGTYIIRFGLPEGNTFRKIVVSH